jgi:hypothetical protein
MIKCLNCGDEFSYGRKIWCCHSTFFGIIFIENRNDHKWNCNKLSNINDSKEMLKDNISELIVIDNQKPINYNWNCETSLRFKGQKELIEGDHLLIYE